jgi:septal ring factor EnvC (AmiA/AmiB activator)
MPRVLLALLVLFAAPACQRASATRSTAQGARDRHITARLDALEHQVQGLRGSEKQLAAVSQKAERRLTSLATRLHAAATGLARIENKVGSVDSSVAAAAASASSASSQAAELARRLAVLEKRFEYHLKHDPGSS